MKIKQLSARFLHCDKDTSDHLQEAHQSFHSRNLWYFFPYDMVQTSELRCTLPQAIHSVPCKLTQNRAFVWKASSFCWLGNIYYLLIFIKQQSRWRLGIAMWLSACLVFEKRWFQSPLLQNPQTNKQQAKWHPGMFRNGRLLSVLNVCKEALLTIIYIISLCS